jgi:hypothetical protein
LKLISGSAAITSFRARCAAPGTSGSIEGNHALKLQLSDMFPQSVEKQLDGRRQGPAFQRDDDTIAVRNSPVASKCARSCTEKVITRIAGGGKPAD